MFEKLELLPEDPVLGIPILFKKYPRPNKVNLSVGAYQDGEGRSYVLEAVKDAEEALSKQRLLKNYLPIEGDPEYIQLAAELIFGVNANIQGVGNETAPLSFFGAQTVGGTSALRIGGDLLKKSGTSCIALSNPSWPNHTPLFEQIGLEVKEYPYYNDKTHQIEFSALLSTLDKLPKGAAVLLHACCHNPTGMDFKFSQWQELCALIAKKALIPFFDFAYQGFSEGIEADAKAIRWFVEQRMEMLVASSFSKCMGLYGERAGFLGVLMKPSLKDQVASQIKRLIRSNYSNPPIHPGRIVSTILKDPNLKKEWERELTTMRERIQCMREALAFGLAAKGAQRDFTFLTNQKGVFSYSGLTPVEVQRLRDEWGIYLLSNGRMNVAGLNSGNLDTVINAMIAVTNAQ